MKLKSKENLIAADILISNNKLSSSIHCYYYSVLQLSMYILCNYHNIDYIKQNTESKSRDSHKYIIETTASFLKDKNIFYMADYNKYMGTLKMLRKKADYSNITIIETDVAIAKKTIEDLTSLLKKNYDL